MTASQKQIATVHVQKVRRFELGGVAAAGGTGKVTSGTVLLPPSQSGGVVQIQGFAFSTPTPSLILMHTREDPSSSAQNPPTNQFATHVVATDTSTIQVLVTRIDPSGEGQGWQQNIVLDIFAID